MGTAALDVIVVGGGAMGSAAAWQLAQRGADVLLFEQFEAGHTKGASHGASRIFRLSYKHQEYIQLAYEALGLWRELEALFTEHNTAPTGDTTVIPATFLKVTVRVDE